MLQLQLVVVHLALVIALLWWNSSSVLLAEAAPEPLEPSAALGVGAEGPISPLASEEKSATNLAAKLFLLDDLVSLENEVTETKKKRSFPGFGSPIDRISSTSVDAKSKQSSPRGRVQRCWLCWCPRKGQTLQAAPLPSPRSVSAPGKVLELPKRRFGVPLDRIGVNHLGNTRG